jgi:hypothetical protein
VNKNLSAAVYRLRQTQQHSSIDGLHQEGFVSATAIQACYCPGPDKEFARLPTFSKVCCENVVQCAALRHTSSRSHPGPGPSSHSPSPLASAFRQRNYWRQQIQSFAKSDLASTKGYRNFTSIATNVGPQIYANENRELGSEIIGCSRADCTFDCKVSWKDLCT